MKVPQFTAIIIVYITSIGLVQGEEKKNDPDVKELSGISVIGNKEAPKSLYIVPWKNSEVGVQSSLTSGLLDESMRPVDKDVFMRELQYYELSQPK